MEEDRNFKKRLNFQINLKISFSSKVAWIWSLLQAESDKRKKKIPEGFSFFKRSGNKGTLDLKKKAFKSLVAEVGKQKRQKTSTEART